MSTYPNIICCLFYFPYYGFTLDKRKGIRINEPVLNCSIELA